MSPAVPKSLELREPLNVSEGCLGLDKISAMSAVDVAGTADLKDLSVLCRAYLYHELSLANVG
jgi:hypothetical protein